MESKYEYCDVFNHNALNDNVSNAKEWKGAGYTGNIGCLNENFMIMDKTIAFIEFRPTCSIGFNKNTAYLVMSKKKDGLLNITN